MAEIRIQRKRRVIWPWILILLIILAIAAWYFLKENEYIKEKAADILPDSVSSINLRDFSISGNKTDEFIRFVEDSSGAMNINRFTKEGLNKLAASLNSIISKNDSLKSTLKNRGDVLEKMAGSISINSDLQKIKEAFIASADLMKSMQEKSYKNLYAEISEVRKSAESLDTDRSIEVQENTIKNFFRRSSSAVKKMKT
jgi:hypothetical protein